MSENFEKEIKEVCKSFGDNEIKILIFSGSQYRGFIQNGIDKLLPSNIKLLYGPGCVLCSVDGGFIDFLVEISHLEKVILALSPELLQAKGINSSLADERKSGYDIRVLYTFQDILLLAKHKRRHKIVFPALGFETAAANTAAAILQAKVAGLFNFTVLSKHRNLPETVKAALNTEKNIDAVIFTPQDIAVRGTKDFELLAKEKSIPVSVTGMEKEDLLEGVYITLKNIAGKKHIFWQQNKYDIAPNGIEKSKQLINEVFNAVEVYYPGFGTILSGGYEPNDNYFLHNAAKRLNLNEKAYRGTTNCICSSIIKGEKKPVDCSNFKNGCTPLNPKGLCMASKEGLCNIEYLYK